MNNHERCALGWNLLKQRDYSAARVHFGHVLASDPNYTSALHGMGYLEHVAGRPREAESLLRLAARRQPTDAEILFHLANALVAQNRRDEAISCMIRAIQISPANPEYHAGYSTQLRLKGRDASALAEAKEALRLRPTAPLTYSQIALTLCALGDAPTAAEASRAGISLDPCCAMNYVTLAYALQHIGDIESAIESLREAIRLDPGTAGAHANLGHLLLTIGKYEQGWLEDEWRLRVPTKGMPNDITSPRCDGRLQRGIRLFVQAEQGFGDTILFARFFPILAKGGLKVILRCRQSLVGLLKRVAGIEE